MVVVLVAFFRMSHFNDSDGDDGRGRGLKS